MAKKMLSEFYFWDKSISKIFEKNYESVFQQKVDAWGYQWGYSCTIGNTLCITPYVNLISNIGWVGTRSSDNSPFINMKTLELKAIANFKGSKDVIHSIDVDKVQFYNIFYRYTNLKQKIVRLLRIFHLQDFARWLFKWLKKLYK